MSPMFPILFTYLLVGGCIAVGMTWDRPMHPLLDWLLRASVVVTWGPLLLVRGIVITSK